VADEKMGLELGAVDYITKPISPPIVMVRVKNQLALKASAEFLRDKNAFLEQEVARRTQELQSIQDVTIMAMASLAETRDNDTGGHIRRTQFYVQTLAEKLLPHPRFAGQLTPAYILTLFKSAPLHDIGKVGIPDRILLKPGRFEPEEFEIMKSHTTLGRDAIQHAEDQLGIKVDFLSCAKEIAYSHQEKWDGSGYPQGLAGDAGMPHEKAVGIIAEGRGKHFDPDITDAFLEIHDQFRAIAECFKDTDGDIEKEAMRIESDFKTVA
jgi:putative two-component system response regulator